MTFLPFNVNDTYTHYCKTYEAVVNKERAIVGTPVFVSELIKQVPGCFWIDIDLADKPIDWYLSTIVNEKHRPLSCTYNLDDIKFRKTGNYCLDDYLINISTVAECFNHNRRGILLTKNVDSNKFFNYLKTLIKVNDLTELNMLVVMLANYRYGDDSFRNQKTVLTSWKIGNLVNTTFRNAQGLTTIKSELFEALEGHDLVDLFDITEHELIEYFNDTCKANLVDILDSRNFTASCLYNVTEEGILDGTTYPLGRNLIQETAVMYLTLKGFSSPGVIGTLLYKYDLELGPTVCLNLGKAGTVDSKGNYDSGKDITGVIGKELKELEDKIFEVTNIRDNNIFSCTNKSLLEIQTVLFEKLNVITQVAYLTLIKEFNLTKNVLTQSEVKKVRYKLETPKLAFVASSFNTGITLNDLDVIEDEVNNKFLKPDGRPYWNRRTSDVSKIKNDRLSEFSTRLAVVYSEFESYYKSILWFACGAEEPNIKYLAYPVENLSINANAFVSFNSWNHNSNIIKFDSDLVKLYGPTVDFVGGPEKIQDLNSIIKKCISHLSSSIDATGLVPVGGKKSPLLEMIEGKVLSELRTPASLYPRLANLPQIVQDLFAYITIPLNIEGGYMLNFQKHNEKKLYRPRDILYSALTGNKTIGYRIYIPYGIEEKEIYYN